MSKVKDWPSQVSFWAVQATMNSSLHWRKQTTLNFGLLLISCEGALVDHIPVLVCACSYCWLWSLIVCAFGPFLPFFAYLSCTVFILALVLSMLPTPQSVIWYQRTKNFADQLDTSLLRGPLFTCCWVFRRRQSGGHIRRQPHLLNILRVSRTVLRSGAYVRCNEW